MTREKAFTSTNSAKKSNTRKRDDPEQSKRFIEVAKNLGKNPEPQAFEKALAKIAKSGARKGRD